MTKVWFTSDLHFRHKNIVKFTDRKLVTTQELHDEWLIDLWNSQVQKGDIVYNLGDFNFSGKLQDWENLINQLNGSIQLVKGNHDSSDVLKKLQHPRMTWDKYLEKTIEGQHIDMFHFPISAWHKQGYGSWHLHGHTHGNLKSEFSQGKILDVGLDSSYNLLGKHRLFSFDEVKEIMQKKEIAMADHHKVNI